MTGRTHDLTAFATLSFITFSSPLIHISLGTTLIALGANLIGGLTPDIDQPTATLWHDLPAGGIIGKILSPLLGGHRFISHSIVGIILFGFIFKYLLILSSHTLIVNQNVVWWAFMIGYISHLVMDTLTREGVPWLFPIPIKFGIPPIKEFRIKTGGFVEKLIIFPGIILLTGYFYYTHYSVVLHFLRSYIH